MSIEMFTIQDFIEHEVEVLDARWRYWRRNMLIAIGILAALVVVLATWHVALHSGLIEVELKKRASRELPKTPPSKPLPPPIGAHGTRLARDYYPPAHWYVNSVNYNPYGMVNVSYDSVFAPARFNGAGNLVHSLGEAPKKPSPLQSKI